MDQTTLGIGTRLQHTQYGPGVIVGIRYATYLISFINHGIKEIDKTDEKLDEIIPENVTAEIETHSDVEKSLLKILRLAGRNKELRVVNDQIGAPTTAAMVAEETVRVLTRYGDSVGLYHLTASGEASWYTFAQAIVRGAGLSTPVVPISSADLAVRTDVNAVQSISPWSFGASASKLGISVGMRRRAHATVPRWRTFQLTKGFPGTTGTTR